MEEGITSRNTRLSIFYAFGKAINQNLTQLKVLVADAFYDDFNKGKTFYHGHTFTANTLGCAIANATLGILEEWDWKGNVEDIHRSLVSRFNQLEDQFNCISNPRTIGSVGAVDIHLPAHRALFKLSQLGFENNLTIRPLGNTIYLYLPLVTNQEELEDIFKKLSDTIQQASKD